eukprot:5690876-Pyramimonas_sp.AAC.1
MARADVLVIGALLYNQLLSSPSTGVGSFCVLDAKSHAAENRTRGSTRFGFTGDAQRFAWQALRMVTGPLAYLLGALARPFRR